MSSILIKNAKIIQPRSPHNNMRMDILVKNGSIKKIGEKLSGDKAQTITSPNLHVSIGWLDIGTICSEPGFEHRETLDSLSRTAAAGGYTAIAPFPNTYPVLDNKSAIQFLLNSTKKHVVDYLPVAAVSKACKGEDMTEMIDLSANGAVAFSDGLKNITSSGLLLRALQYSKVVDGLVIHHPSDPGIANGNDVHEGEVSTGLGLKACPALSELMILERDIQLANYAEARLLVHNISSAESTARLAGLKSKNIYVSVPYLNLCKTDTSIAAFDVNYKVSPPVRSEQDRSTLMTALKEGSIDCITSNHVPLEEELKKKEFVYAESGAAGLQTVFAGLCSFADQLSLNRLVSCLAYNPRKVLGLPVPAIEEGAKANLTLFDPDDSWTLDARTNASKSKNSPFWGQELKGKVIGVINAKQSQFNNY